MWMGKELGNDSFYHLMHYSAKRSLAVARRMSVCLSVTLVDHDHIGWKSWKLIARTISPTSSLFIVQRSSTYSQGNIEKFCGENVHSTRSSITSGWIASTESHDLRWRCGCLFTFVGTLCDHLCDSTAFLFFMNCEHPGLSIMLNGSKLWQSITPISLLNSHCDEEETSLLKLISRGTSFCCFLPDCLSSSSLLKSSCSFTTCWNWLPLLVSGDVL